MNTYQEFIQTKIRKVEEHGFEVETLTLGDYALFPFQEHIVKWALKRGRAAIFADTGLGKSFMQSAWAHHVREHTGGYVLILAPLAVAQQTVKEAAKIGVKIEYTRERPTKPGIYITNYEMLENVASDIPWSGIVLDESSILKSFMGKTKRQLVEFAQTIDYRLACTATPSPNDYVELGNHAEFVGVKSRQEMLATWFVNDLANLQDWRLKKHAVEDFWQWVCSWAMCVSRPSDIGDYDDSGYNLPPLQIKHCIVESPNMSNLDTGELIRSTQLSATNLHKSLRESLENRKKKAQEILGDETALLWCNTNYEADALKEAFPDAHDLRGSLPLKRKEEMLDDFISERNSKLISKPSICGYGLNFQHCRKMIFLGLSFSYEDFYQAVRRCYRFGQTKPVEVFVILSENELGILKVIEDKSKQHDDMKLNMMKAVRRVQGAKDLELEMSDHNKLVELARWIYDSEANTMH